MITFIIIAILIFIAIYCYKNRLFVEFSTFFKKGFKKNTNKFGLYLYTGKQGTGKTYSSVKFCNKLLKHGNVFLITNIKSFYDCINKKYKCLYKSDIFEIIDYIIKNEAEFKKHNTQILVFFDEIFTVCEKSGSLTPKVLSFLSQLRKREIIFVSTAQEWSEINITFRRYCRYQISCSMISFPILNYAFVINTINDGDGIRWDNDLQDFIAPILQTNVSKGLKSIIDLYDTFETITLTSSINKTRAAASRFPPPKQ